MRNVCCSVLSTSTQSKCLEDPLMFTTPLLNGSPTRFLKHVVLFLTTYGLLFVPFPFPSLFSFSPTFFLLPLPLFPPYFLSFLVCTCKYLKTVFLKVVYMYVLSSSIFPIRLDSRCAHISGLYGFWRKLFTQPQYWHAAQVSLISYYTFSSVNRICF